MMKKQFIMRDLQKNPKCKTRDSRRGQIESLHGYRGRDASWRSVIITWLIAALTFGSLVAADTVRENKSQYLAAHDGKQTEDKSGWLGR